MTNDDTMQHCLKCHPEHYQKSAQGLKPFEIRLNDRDFNIGDKVFLEEYDPKTEEYTGECLVGDITHISDFQQKDNYVVLGIKYTRTDDCIVIKKSDVPKGLEKVIEVMALAERDYYQTAQSGEGIEMAWARGIIQDLAAKLIQAQLEGSDD